MGTVRPFHTWVLTRPRRLQSRPALPYSTTVICVRFMPTVSTAW